MPKMFKNIFLGSSTASLVELREIEKFLKQRADVNAVLWEDVFTPSSLIFEKLETIPSGFSGAIFLAAPNHPTTIGGTVHNFPNQNVLFEFGLFAGILGRKRVALARHTDTFLSNDLGGFTYIDMGKYPGDGRSHPLSNAIQNSIVRWLDSL